MAQTGSSRFSLFDPPGLTIIVYGMVAISWMMGELGSPMGQLLLIPAGLGVILVPIFTMRALGQAVMSRLAGGTLLRLTSGFLKLERTNGRLSLGLNNQWRSYPGSAVTAPGPAAKARTWIAAREAGGFLGLLVYVSIIMTIIPQVQRLDVFADDLETQQLVGTTLFGLSVLVITLGVWQLINRQAPRIWRMWRRGDAAEREASIIAMTSYLVAGRRPAVWPDGWPERAMWDGDESVEGLYGYRFGYLHAVDMEDDDRADRYFRYLEEHIDRLPSKLQVELVYLEQPFVEARIRNNPGRARELLDELDSRAGKRYRFRRVQAAVLLAEGETQSAREQATDGLNVTALLNSDDGEVKAEIALLERILDEAGGALTEAEAEATAATG